jgi:hypothetical protein
MNAVTPDVPEFLLIDQAAGFTACDGHAEATIAALVRMNVDRLYINFRGNCARKAGFEPLSLGKALGR